MLKSCKFKEAGLTKEHPLVGNRGPSPEKMHLHLPTICFVHQGHPLLPPELTLWGATLKQATFSRALSHLALPQRVQATAEFLQAWREDGSRSKTTRDALGLSQSVESESWGWVSQIGLFNKLSTSLQTTGRGMISYPGRSSWSLAQNLWLTSTQQFLSYLVSVSIQRKGLLEELRPGEAGQDLLDSGLGTGLSRLPPLPRPVAQPHLSTPSPGPEPRNATVQSNASLSSKLPDQPSWLLRTRIWHKRSQPQICRQPHCPEPGG